MFIKVILPSPKVSNTIFSSDSAFKAYLYVKDSFLLLSKSKCSVLKNNKPGGPQDLLDSKELTQIIDDSAEEQKSGYYTYSFFIVHV